MSLNILYTWLMMSYFWGGVLEAGVFRRPFGGFSGANGCDSEIVDGNRSAGGSGLSPHFPSCEIALVVEGGLKPHE